MSNPKRQARDKSEEPVAIEIQLSTSSSGSSYNPVASGEIVARRSGSAGVLTKNEKGEIIVESKVSDIGIAVKNRLSASSLPSIFPAGADFQGDPLLNAEDALERTGGKGPSGAYKEHLYTLSQLADSLKTNLNIDDPSKSAGLAPKRAAELLKERGPNVLTPPPRLPLWALFLLQFTNLLMVLLEITALLCIVLYLIDTSVIDNLYLGVLLFIAIIVTCYETFSQEAKSDNLMAQFRALVPESASVLRDGTLQPIAVAELVIGDVIRLKAGDKVPADCRVLQSQGMKVDQSMITGEAEPVDVQVLAADENPLEAKNLIFNGSLVVDGGAYAVVVKTGDATLIGTMVELTSDVGKQSSTLKRDIDYFVKVLTLFALCQAALIFIVGLSRGYNPFSVFVNGFVVIMIGNVPQGLPSTVTASLYLVAERMSRQNVFVKKLDIIETLGACTLICTDKTGTLTLNQMTVAHIWTAGQRFTSQEFTAAISTETPLNTAPSATDPTSISFCSAATRLVMKRLLEIAALNSRVVIEQKSAEVAPTPSGDATELGLYRFCADCLQKWRGTQIESFRALFPKTHEIPFNSAFKWQMSAHQLEPEKGDSMLLKGAPDVLIDKCGFYLSANNTIEPVDDAFRARYTAVYESFGGQGERVLGFAMRNYKDNKRHSDCAASDPHFNEHLRTSLIGKDSGVTAIKDLVFVGLITLQDPPRPEVPQAVKDCQAAFVQVVMVTGDHPLTAEAIARQIGLVTLPTRADIAKQRGVPLNEVAEDDVQAVIVHGAQIPNMTEDDWRILVSKKEIVFARTSPEQKLIIVKEFTKAGHVTAMTGDGVNDSPALKQAAIGVAMGLNGSAVAKEAADVVLLDDNFASIVVGIKEGRLLFHNLKKSVAYTLAHLTPEVFPVLMWGFAGVVQPMGSMLTLCIDLLTELVPATSFAFEEAEASIMQLPPRNVKTEKLTSMNLLCYSYFQAGLIETAACWFYVFRVFNHYGVTSAQVMNNNNQHFPSASDDGIFVTNDGREYDAADQKRILQRVQAGYYLMIVVSQAVHIYNCRTTTLSIFSHGLLRNRWANIGVFVAIALGCFVVYCPGIQEIVSARDPYSIEIFYGALLLCAVFWPFCEGRKYLTRNYPQHWLNKYLAW